MDSVIVQAALAEAEESGTPVAAVSLDRIARRAGLSRSTVYRRVRNRQALDDAVRLAGADPGARIRVRDRAIAAAAETIVSDGVAALSVEGVARRVGCSASSVHNAFGGREGLLSATFEQRAPLPAVEHLLSAEPERFADFASGVRTIYTTVFDTISRDAAVLEALFAEILAKPNGIGAQFFRDRVLPRIIATIGGWLRAQVDAGNCIDMPLSLLVPQLIGPISVHLLARHRLAAAGQPVPDRVTVIDTMTSTFCNAVGTKSQC